MMAPPRPGAPTVTEIGRDIMEEAAVKVKKWSAISLWAVNLGLVANALLAALKVSVGIIGHSPALLADGVNSTSDVAYYVIVRVFIQLSRKPADAEHPYGHRQFETIAAVVVGAFVLTTAVAIFWDAVNKVYDHWTAQAWFARASHWALVVAMLTVVVKIILTIVTSRMGRRTANPAVLALARDHRNDIFAASAAGVGILFGRLGLPWADPLAGAMVALVILWTGINILREASVDLMDTIPGQVLREQVVGHLRSVPGVLNVEEVLAHRFGPYLVVNVTLGVDRNLSVAAADQIASQVERTLCRNIDLVQRVHVHCHPARS
jgi:cation diffusion facilitator family transporter